MNEALATQARETELRFPVPKKVLGTTNVVFASLLFWNSFIEPFNSMCFIFVICFFVCLFKTGSHCPLLEQNFYVDLTGLKLRDPPVSASGVLG